MLRCFITLLFGVVLTTLVMTDAEARTAPKAPQVHVVKDGDTLGAIAQRYGLSVSELKRLNGLSGSRLKIDQKLALSRAAAPPVAATVKPSPAKATAKTAPRVRSEHVVKSGDSLYSIARRHGTSVAALKQLNGLRSEKLSPGQRLVVAGGTAPAVKAGSRSRVAADVHVVRKGETLSSIARRHGMAVADLKQINDLSSSRLKIGQRLALSGREYNPAPVFSPGDVTEDEVLEMAYAAESPLEQMAFNYLSTPYRFGGSTRKGIDCSAFVQSVFRDVDVKLPRSAREQFRVGEKVERDQLQPGDLLFFRTYARFPSHVGIYLGEGRMIHASSRSRRVVITSIDYPYYVKRYIGAKRIEIDGSKDDGTIAQAAEELLTPNGTDADQDLDAAALDVADGDLDAEEDETIGDESQVESIETAVEQPAAMTPAIEQSALDRPAGEVQSTLFPPVAFPIVEVAAQNRPPLN